jgi:hypothetical protein
VTVLVGAAIAAVLALIVAGQTLLSMRGHGHSFARVFGWQFAWLAFWALVAPFALRAGSTFASGVDARRILRVTGIGLALMVAHAILSAQASVWIQPFMPVQTDRFGPALRNQAGMVVLDMLVYAVLLTVGSALTVSRRARQLAIRESRLEAELARANLDALRLEIQPHFLFNTLNTIAALIRRQSSGRALDMLVGLSDLMRGTLERNPTHLTALEVEISFVQKYVDLYRVRFSDRLDVTFDVEPAAAALAVPTFILQPLVENAFRHGIADQARRCHVEIGARVEGRLLRLWVADDGAGVAHDFMVRRDAGTGLRNVVSRVESLCGPSARVEVTRRDTGGTLACIVLPVLVVPAVEQAAS